MDYSSGKIEASGEALQSSDTNTSAAALLPQSGNSLSHMAADVQEDTDMVAGDKQHDSLDLPTPPSVSSCVSTSWGGFEFTELQAVLKDMEKQMETNGTRMFCNEQEADDSASENENEDEDTQQTELNLRDYQQELAEPALLGHNVLICASTGTGKTEVAIKVAMQHLSKQSDQQRVRVAFLVKTQALARQQYQRFRKYYSPSRVKLLVGGGNASNPIDLSAVLGDFDVFVMTAGIFRNALEKGATPVRFDDFRLIIFDEAHSAMKGTDYALILRMYVKRKKELLLLSTNSNSSATAQSTAMDTLPSTANSTVLVSDEKPTSKHDNEVGANPVENRLPQIIGLTASPGTEKASNLNDALDHILQLCAMLDAKVSIVRRSKATLADYTNRTASRHVPCSTRQPDRFRALVEEEMALISQKINQLLQKHVKRVENDLGYLPAAPERAEFGTISYSSKIGALRKKIRKISKPELTRDLQICTDWLRIYNIGLVLNSAVLHRHAVTYIKEQVVLRRYANLHANGQEDALGGQSRPDVKCQIIFRFICLTR